MRITCSTLSKTKLQGGKLRFSLSRPFENDHNSNRSDGISTGDVEQSCSINACDAGGFEYQALLLVLLQSVSRQFPHHGRHCAQCDFHPPFAFLQGWVDVRKVLRKCYVTHKQDRRESDGKSTGIERSIINIESDVHSWPNPAVRPRIAGCRY